MALAGHSGHTHKEATDFLSHRHSGQQVGTTSLFLVPTASSPDPVPS